MTNLCKSIFDLDQKQIDEYFEKAKRLGFKQIQNFTEQEISYIFADDKSPMFIVQTDETSVFPIRDNRFDHTSKITPQERYSLLESEYRKFTVLYNESEEALDQCMNNWYKANYSETLSGFEWIGSDKLSIFDYMCLHSNND